MDLLDSAPMLPEHCYTGITTSARAIHPYQPPLPHGRGSVAFRGFFKCL
jgi:hypothetical protein